MRGSEREKERERGRRGRRESRSIAFGDFAISLVSLGLERRNNKDTRKPYFPTVVLVGRSIGRSSILNDGISRIRERSVGISSCQIHRRLFSRLAHSLLVPTSITLVDETSLKVLAPLETVYRYYCFIRHDTSIHSSRVVVRGRKEQLDRREEGKENKEREGRSKGREREKLGCVSSAFSSFFATSSLRTAQYFPERRERAENGEEWGRRTEIKAKGERERDGRAGRRLNAATEKERRGAI